MFQGLEASGWGIEVREQELRVRGYYTRCNRRRQLRQKCHPCRRTAPAPPPLLPPPAARRTAALRVKMGQDGSRLKI
jgi:hypothetical protein